MCSVGGGRPPSAAAVSTSMNGLSVAPFVAGETSSQHEVRLQMWNHRRGGFHFENDIQSAGTSGAPSVMSNASSLHNEVMAPFEPLQMMGGGPCSSNSLMTLSTAADQGAAIEEVAQYLLDPDPEIVSRATNVLLDAVKAMAADISGNPTLIRNLVQRLITVIQSGSVPSEVLHRCLTTVYHLSSNSRPHSTEAIIQLQGLPMILNVLGKTRQHDEQEKLASTAIAMLHNLLIHKTKKAVAFLRAEGSTVHLLGSLLVSNFTTHSPIQSTQLLAILVDCVHFVIGNDKTMKLKLLECGATTKLVDILNSHEYEKLLYFVARLMKILAVCPKNKPALVEADAFAALGRRLQHVSPRLNLQCLLAMRNLSDVAMRYSTPHDLPIQVLDFISTSHGESVEAAGGILQNLTANNPEIKLVFDKQGVLCLVQALFRFWQNANVVEYCLATLRHLTSIAGARQQFVNSENGLMVLLKLLSAYEKKAGILKCALAVVRNLAVQEENLPALHRCRLPSNNSGFVTYALLVCERSFGALQEAFMKGQRMPPKFDDVSAVQLLEVSIGALNFMAHHAEVEREILSRPDVVGWVVSSLEWSYGAAAQKAALTLLLWLTRGRTGLPILNDEPTKQATLKILSQLCGRSDKTQPQQAVVASLAESLYAGLNTCSTSDLISMSNNVLSGDDSSSPWEDASMKMEASESGAASSFPPEHTNIFAPVASDFEQKVERKYAAFSDPSSQVEQPMEESLSNLSLRRHYPSPSFPPVQNGEQMPATVQQQQRPFLMGAYYDGQQFRSASGPPPLPPVQTMPAARPPPLMHLTQHNFGFGTGTENVAFRPSAVYHQAH